MSESPTSAELPREIEQAAQHVLPRDLLHDLRTQLGHIMGYSELLIEQMQSAGHQEFVPFLEKIQMAARQLLGLMQDNFQSATPPAVAAGDGSGTAPLQAMLEEPPQKAE